MQSLWRWWYWRGVLLLWCPIFFYWHCLEKLWGWPLPQLFSGEVSPFGVCNWKQFVHRWRPISYLLLFCHLSWKIWCQSPLICLLHLVTGVQNHWKNIPPIPFCVYHVWLGVYIQVTPLFDHQWLIFIEYWDTGGMSCTLVFGGRGMKWELTPYSFTLFLTISMSCGVFMNWLGNRNYRVFFPPWWWILIFPNVIWCGGLVVLVLALSLVWGVREAGTVTALGSTLRGGGVIFFFC